MYDEFNGLASFKDVITARNKRAATKNLENETLLARNVDAPDFRFLWLNKEENKTLVYKLSPLPSFRVAR